MTQAKEPEDEAWKTPKLLPRRPLRILDSYRPLRIHSEFHRHVLAWEEALIEFHGLTLEGDGRERVDDAYGALQMRKKELYEGVRDNTENPTDLWTIHIKF